MIYVTGDCHADFRRFNTENFPEQKEMTRDDYVIICGDFGVWDNSKEEQWWFDWLAGKNFTLLFVDGNHDNHDRLATEFEVVDFHGGKAHKIRDNIYHLMRGQVFELEGKKFFTFGGASSHDIQDGILEPDDFTSDRELMREYNLRTMCGEMLRINHRTWWEAELPSQEEMDTGIANLERHNNEVDFVVSHCCPQTIASIMSAGLFKPDVLTQYFNVISERITFRKWLFGHYHDNCAFLDKFILLYEQIIRIV